MDPTGGQPRTPAVSGNPGATNVLAGSGALGDYLGLNQDGIRFGGITITDANGLLSGGLAPGKWTGDSLTIADLSIDTEKLLGWEGGLFGTQFLYYTGGPVNAQAGTVLGYNSLDVVPPRNRAELYELWFRQELLDKKLIVRVGKSVPTYDFNNVVSTVHYGDDALNIPAVTSGLMTPLYVSPTMLGIIPGYYNSATGIVATAVPTDNLYAKYGLFDGNLADGRQTGLYGPLFNGYMLHLVETGASWTVGEHNKPGKAGFGWWRQTGTLRGFSGPIHGADGYYLFGSQRLYYEQPGASSRGLSAFWQFASSDNDFVFTQRYFGFGLTYFGPLPRRDNDSAGFVLGYGRTNDDPNAGTPFAPSGSTGPTPLGGNEVILSWYYQMQVTKFSFFQPNLTYIPDPAARPGTPGAFAVTLRAIVLF